MPSRFSFNDITIENVTKKNIFGIVIDNKLNFKSYVKNIGEKANQNSVRCQDYQS